MNKARKEELLSIAYDLYNVSSSLDCIKYDEEESFNNLPFSLQSTDRGYKMQDAIDKMDEFSDSINGLASKIEDYCKT